MAEQHDDHCWLVYNGRPVKIMRMSGLDEIVVWAWNYDWQAFDWQSVIDLSRLDWSYYHAVYKRRLGETFPEDVG